MATTARASAWRAGKELRAKQPGSGRRGVQWFLAVLFPADQLAILPYNRLVRDLNGLSAERRRWRTWPGSAR